VTHSCKADRTRTIQSFVALRYSQVFHLVREPLAAMRAISGYGQTEWSTVRDLIGFDTAKYANPRLCALHFYVIWNQLIELVADWRFRVEDTPVTELCTRAGLECDEVESESPTHHGAFPAARGTTPFTWSELQSLDSDITELAKELASTYGYSTADMVE
jgi:hypothetical protein